MMLSGCTTTRESDRSASAKDALPIISLAYPVDEPITGIPLNEQ